jgi:hypothetical protein
MRGALQARSAQLPDSMPGAHWSSRIVRLRRWRKDPAIAHLEQIERFERERERLAQFGGRGTESRRQWIRRF